MSPAVVVALGTMAGISLASLIDLPYLAIWAIFIFTSSAALMRAIFQPSKGQTLTIFLIFVLLGCLLLIMAPDQAESHRAETHTNPLYKSIAKLSSKALNGDIRGSYVLRFLVISYLYLNLSRIEFQ